MAKGVAHYTEDGRLYKGGTHKMPDGSLHTGKTHTDSSVKLFHLNELSKEAKKKAMSAMDDKTLSDNMGGKKGRK
jgi:hypothetical protein|tara:strand:+ start:615 stop:839 length:225 start_codon:yes stop_codon:yes gene_type:complete